MDYFKIATNIIGFCGTIMMITMFQQNDRKRILIFQFMGTALFCIHFSMLASYTGAALNAIAAIRCIIYYNSEKKFFKSPVWLYLFIAISIAAGIITWEGLPSILPTVAMVVGSVSVWVKKPRHIRILSLIPSPMWMTYNIISHSYPGMITEAFVMTSITISIIRYDILKKQEKRLDTTT